MKEEEHKTLNPDDFEDYELTLDRSKGSGGGKKKNKKQGSGTLEEARRVAIKGSIANEMDREDVEADIDVVLEQVLKSDQELEGLPRLVEYIFWVSRNLKEDEFNEIDYVIPEKEIGFEAIRSSGPGGQNVNKVASKVRMSHKLGGWTVVVDESRDQSKNRQIAELRLTEIVVGHLNKWREVVDKEKIDSSIATVLRASLKDKIQGDSVKMEKKRQKLDWLYKVLEKRDRSSI